jgi:hypothetical protein
MQGKATNNVSIAVDSDNFLVLMRGFSRKRRAALHGFTADASAA